MMKYFIVVCLCLLIQVACVILEGYIYARVGGLAAFIWLCVTVAAAVITAGYARKLWKQVR